MTPDILYSDSEMTVYAISPVRSFVDVVVVVVNNVERDVNEVSLCVKYSWR